MWKKCKVIELTTENITNVAYVNWGSHDVPHWDYSYNHNGPTAEEFYKYLYFLSDDEIKEGDWCYDNTYLDIVQATIDNYPVLDKIIASTDPSLNVARPSDDFIKEYCHKGGIDEVMVEYIATLNVSSDVKYRYQPILAELKVNPDNTINIKIVKDSWSREEVVLLCKKAFNAGSDWQYSLRGDTEIVEDNFDDWLKEKL